MTSAAELDRVESLFARRGSDDWIEKDGFCITDASVRASCSNRNRAEFYVFYGNGTHFWKMDRDEDRRMIRERAPGGRQGDGGDVIMTPPIGRGERTFPYGVVLPTRRCKVIFDVLLR